MRIALLSNFRGGLRPFVTNLSRGLMLRGFEVDILCPAHLTGLQTEEGNAKVRIYSGLKAFGKLSSGRYDIIHSNISILGLISNYKTILGRVPFVQTYHGFPQWWAEPGIMEKTAYALELNAMRLSARSSGARVAVSHFVESVVQSWLGIDASVIHNGISHYPIQKSKAESRKLLQIEDESLAVLFVGRLHPYKDPNTLLSAVARLNDYGRKVRLFIVGDGPLLVEFTSNVRTLGLEGLVTIWSHVPNGLLHSIYSAADIFCLPSINEAFGMVLLEAMDHSLPLVVSESGSLPEVAGDAGLRFSAGDAVDLSRKLLQLLDDESLRKTLGMNGQKRVESKFSLSAMVDRYAHLYEDVV